jgi:release factor glutamine methyltransferase
MNVLDKLRRMRDLLEKNGVNDADREAEIIVSHALGTDRVSLYSDNPDIPEESILHIDQFVRRRLTREPLQYILGYTEFYGIKIILGTGVLIPRPETELLVEAAIKIVSEFKGGSSKFKIIDLCTGSGCIALALAQRFPDAEVYGTDISEAALQYAEENARTNSITNATFLKGSLFNSLKKNLRFDLIISNPPYIRRQDIKDLQPEIKDWEPVEALDGGEDGLDYYRAIIPEAGNYLKKHGYLMFELGIHQAKAVKKMAEDEGFGNISLIKDYAGIDRMLIAKNDS